MSYNKELQTYDHLGEGGLNNRKWEVCLVCVSPAASNGSPQNATTRLGTCGPCPVACCVDYCQVEAQTCWASGVIGSRERLGLKGKRGISQLPAPCCPRAKPGILLPTGWRRKAEFWEQESSMVLAKQLLNWIFN